MGNRRPRLVVEVDTNELCKFGCGNVARYKNLSGLICSRGASGCPENKRKIRTGLLRKHEEMRLKYGKAGLYSYKDLPQDVKDRMNVNKGLTKGTSERIRKQHEKRHQNFLDGKWVPKITGVAANAEMRWKRNYIPYVDTNGKHFKLESLHEWEVANILDKANIHWARPNCLKLSDGRKYEPDFYLKEYDIYLDPKTKWKGRALERYQGYDKQNEQLAKIKKCEEELSVKCLILWSEDQRSHCWAGILEQIREYSAT